ncbi:hypothetical protein JQ632_16345 [Bradyrhizobium liaoningense]|nr:hypothetical protein [Bradyrhizobium liaoningense]MBR0715523.1 hypothetical protein [Bradyrhizobium liaoningense]
MRMLILTVPLALATLIVPATAQQNSNETLQHEADKGVKTRNSGASGFVSEQEKPGSATHIPGQSNSTTTTGAATAAPSAPNSGTGIAGAPGNKNGPPARQGTVGSSSKNPSVEQQDSSNVKGLPGNKSGPPAKR